MSYFIYILIFIIIGTIAGISASSYSIGYTQSNKASPEYLASSIGLSISLITLFFSVIILSMLIYTSKGNYQQIIPASASVYSTAAVPSGPVGPVSAAGSNVFGVPPQQSFMGSLTSVVPSLF